MTHDPDRFPVEKPRDPVMPRLMPPHVERAIAELLGFRNRPNPIELYDAIREALDRGPTEP